MAEPSKPMPAPPAVKPGELPAPDQLEPMPSGVMNWEKQGLDGKALNGSPAQPNRHRE
jgi:hypothetical protein